MLAGWSRRFVFIVLAQIGLFGVGVSLPVWLAARAHCYTLYDLGIYAQGIAQLHWVDINPWLTARQVRIFSDHFDPILSVAKIFEILLQAPFAGLLTENVFALLSLVPLLFMVRRGTLHERNATWAVAMVLFNAGTTTAFHFPIHPTTWSMAAWVAVMAAWHRQAYKTMLAALVVLFACKEEFPFVGLVLGAVLMLERRRRVGLGVLLLSALWLAFVFGVREAVWGPQQPYGSKLFLGLRQNPAAYLMARFTAAGMVSRLGSLLAPFAPFALWVWRARLPVRGRFLTLLLPGLLVRFFGMSWRHHYNGCMVAGSVGALLPTLAQKPMPRWVCWGTFAILLAANSNPLRFAWQMLRHGETYATHHCPAQTPRLQAIAAAVKYLHDHPEGRALVGNNLAAAMVYRPHLYVINGDQPVDTAPYRYVLTEQPPFGARWPGPARIGALMAIWRSAPDTEIVMDNAHVFLARGSFFADR